MDSALEIFDENIARVKTLGGLTTAMKSMMTGALDLSDLLRAQYVFAVSALDLYIHEVTRLGMLEVFDGLRPPTPAYLRFRISLDCVIADLVVARGKFDADIRTQHGFVAFQPR